MTPGINFLNWFRKSILTKRHIQFWYRVYNEKIHRIEHFDYTLLHYDWLLMHLSHFSQVLETLYCNKWTKNDGAGAVIITPTRELALQIFKTLKNIGAFHDFSAGLVIGGKDLHFERKRMDTCNIIICTPGRLLDHLEKSVWHSSANMKVHAMALIIIPTKFNFNISSTMPIPQILVLDEADRCLDLGFKKTMNCIIENLPQERQTLLFSATQTR